MANMTRPRRAGNKDLPDNLYRYADPRTGRDYWRFRDPRTGKFHGLGTDQASAIADAVALNAAIRAQMQTRRLEVIAQPAIETGKTWGAVTLHHLELAEKLQARGKIAANTLKSKRSLVNAWTRSIGNTKPVKNISVLDLAGVLNQIVEAGKERQAQSMRSECIEIFRTAIAEGWVNDNPAAKTRAISPDVKRARLTLEHFTAIYQTTKNTWLRNAMALAIVTAQRREDIVLAKFTDIGPEGWRCIQTKTATKLILPLDLRLDSVGLSLADVVRQCRATGIVSRNLVHQVRPRGNSPVGSPIFKDTLSKAFHESIMELGLDWEGKHPPTFHEIRSLSERMYAAQGNVNTQTLLGHKDPRTTAIYKDARGAEWLTVKVG